jgi:DNA-binding NarL/FixJ family response regulator
MRLRLSDLTPRERAVAELCPEPLTVEQVARKLKRLDGKPGTVTRSYVQGIIERIAGRIDDGEGRARLRVSAWVVAQRKVA